jgi:ribosomal protein S18 acetylase RimI-like enzyme
LANKPDLSGHLEFESVPLAKTNLQQLDRLLTEEVAAWRIKLHWDYSRTADLIREYAQAGVIPGLGLLHRGHLWGYGYYMMRDGLGSVGDIFASQSCPEPEAAGEFIFSRMLGEMIDHSDCWRIEGQLFSLAHAWGDILQATALKHRPRIYMRRNISRGAIQSSIVLRPWENHYLPSAANLLFCTYQDHLDSEISACYQSVRNCSEFLRNLVLMPGCGDFLPSASAAHIDGRGNLGAFILITRIEPKTALVPQLCVRPDLEGKGIGGSLLENACGCLKRMGYQRIFLCVTGANKRARQLYLRHQFTDVQDFSAFYWNRV